MKFFVQVVASKVSPPHRSTQNSHHKKLKSSRKLRAGIKRLKREMIKTSEDQKSIKESQREVRKKVKEIKEDCKFIKKDAKQITRLSERMESRLDLMFMILEARKNKDFIKANILSRPLRMLLVTTSDGHNNENGKANVANNN